MIDNQILIRAAAEPIVCKIIRDLKTGTKRSIRNAIEFGIIFSKNKKQKELFSIAKKVASNGQNMYDGLIKRMLQGVDNNIIKTIGMNLGISSFSSGGKQIRKIYDETGKANSWIEHLEKQSWSCGENLIGKYNSDGIYAFIVEDISSTNELKKLIDIATDMCKSTFFIKIIDNIVDNTTANLIRAAKNIILVINVEDEFCKDRQSQLLKVLRENNLLFGFYKNYDETIKIDEEIDKLKSFIKNGYMFGVYACKNYNNNVYEWVCKSRINGRLPILLFDYYMDTDYIKKMVLKLKFNSENF